MEKEQVIPDDIFMDSYEKYPMGDIRKAYQQGRIDERNKGKWTDDDMFNAWKEGDAIYIPGERQTFKEWLEKYKNK